MIKFREKSYSFVSIGASLIGLFSANRLNRKFYEILSSSNFRDKSINEKILKTVPDDVVVVDLGCGSFYMNPRRIKMSEVEKMKKSLTKKDMDKIKNPVGLNDYILKCILEGKRLIAHSDLDPTPALAHEVGHLRFDESKIGDILQSRTAKYLSTNLSNLSFLASLFGSDLATAVLPIIFNSPTLASEFMASKLGYELLRDLGCSKDQLERCKVDLSSAWMTYMMSTLKSSAKQVLIGNLVRPTMKLYSDSRSDYINNLINLLSSVALGNFIFEEDDNVINCKVTNNEDTYLLGKIEFDENNILRVTNLAKSLPTEEPTRSYSLAILELINSLDKKSYNYSIEFLNKLSNNGKV